MARAWRAATKTVCTIKEPWHHEILGRMRVDFFETREKYRRQEVQGYMSWITRLSALALSLWLGWQWGSLEQRRLQADADLALFESNQQVQTLYSDNERLTHKIIELQAEKLAQNLTSDPQSSKLIRLIKGQIARGTKMEQIYQSLQSIGKPVNCRIIETASVAVATELYSGVESNVTLFDGGLGLHIEGQPQSQGSKNDPWFDPNRPIFVRFVYLGSQKVATGTLPMRTVLPAEDWLLLVELDSSELQGYVSLTVKNCAVR
jgi:hypothetical protein